MYCLGKYVCFKYRGQLGGTGILFPKFDMLARAQVFDLANRIRFLKKSVRARRGGCGLMGNGAPNERMHPQSWHRITQTSLSNSSLGRMHFWSMFVADRHHCYKIFVCSKKSASIFLWQQDTFSKKNARAGGFWVEGERCSKLARSAARIWETVFCLGIPFLKCSRARAILECIPDEG